MKTRQCNNPDCIWLGTTDRYVGAIGPLCPECGETTEEVNPDNAYATNPNVPTKHDNNFQMRCAEWMKDTFGKEIANDKRERMYRFGEEAIELMQACGATMEDMMRLMLYVYGRPVGDLVQEVGGTMVTLTALCEAYKVDVMSCAWKEQLRCELPEVQAKIRAKQEMKRKMIGYSPLPGQITEETEVPACKTGTGVPLYGRADR